MNSLGTPSTAAIVPSVIATVATYILIFVWLEMRGRNFTKKGIVFNDPTLKMQLSPEEMNIDEDQGSSKLLDFHDSYRCYPCLLQYH